MGHRGREGVECGGVEDSKKWSVISSVFFFQAEDGIRDRFT